MQIWCEYDKQSDYCSKRTLWQLWQWNLTQKCVCQIQTHLWFLTCDCYTLVQLDRLCLMSVLHIVVVLHCVLIALHQAEAPNFKRQVLQVIHIGITSGKSSQLVVLWSNESCVKEKKNLNYQKWNKTLKYSIFHWMGGGHQSKQDVTVKSLLTSGVHLWVCGGMPRLRLCLQFGTNKRSSLHTDEAEQMPLPSAPLSQ